jgi:hypothetical protein
MPDFNYSINVNINNGTKTLLHIIMIDTVLLCGNSGYDWNTNFVRFRTKQEKLKSKSYFKSLEEKLKKATLKNASFILIAGHCYAAYQPKNKLIILYLNNNTSHIIIRSNRSFSSV